MGHGFAAQLGGDVVHNLRQMLAHLAGHRLGDHFAGRAQEGAHGQAFELGDFRSELAQPGRGLGLLLAAAVLSPGLAPPV